MGGATRLSRVTSHLSRSLLWSLVLLLPFDVVRPQPRVVGFAVSPVELAVLVVLVATVLAWFVAPRRLVGRSLWAPAVALLAVMGLSAWQTPAFQDEAFSFVGRTALGMGLAVASTYLLRDARDVARVLRLVALGALVVAALGLFEYLGSAPVIDLLEHFRYQVTRVGGRVRISSTLLYPTITSQYLEMALPLLVAWLLPARHPALRLALLAGIALVTEAILLTVTRSALPSLGTALALMAFLEWRRRARVSRSLLASLAFLPTLLLATALFDPLLGLRLTHERDTGWLRASYDAPTHAAAPAGASLMLPVRVTNTGRLPWEGEAPFTLSYHWFDEKGVLVEFEGARTPLPDLAPGESTTVNATVLLPARPGEYLLGWDAVQEGVAWFNPSEPPAWTHVAALGVALGRVPSSPLPPAAAPEPVQPPSPSRRLLWLAALRLWAQSPLLGVGPDLFRLRYGSVLGLTRADPSIYTNNLYLELLADVGLAGLAAFGWLTWRLSRVAGQALRSSRTAEEWWLVVGVSAALLTTYVHGLLDVFWAFWPTALLFWLLVGSLAVITPSARGRGGWNPDEENGHSVVDARSVR